jgi:hypothetical protein
MAWITEPPSGWRRRSTAGSRSAHLRLDLLAIARHHGLPEDWFASWEWWKQFGRVLALEVSGRPAATYPDCVDSPRAASSHTSRDLASFSPEGEPSGFAPIDLFLGFVPSDFEDMRQFAVEYTAAGTDPRRRLGRFPVLNLLLKSTSTGWLRYDFDALRVDTVKYVDPKFIQRFGTAMGEFAYSIGRKTHPACRESVAGADAAPINPRRVQRQVGNQ